MFFEGVLLRWCAVTWCRLTFRVLHTASWTSVEEGRRDGRDSLVDLNCISCARCSFQAEWLASIFEQERSKKKTKQNRVHQICEKLLTS